MSTLRGKIIWIEMSSYKVWELERYIHYSWGLVTHWGKGEGGLNIKPQCVSMKKTNQFKHTNKWRTHKPIKPLFLGQQQMSHQYGPHCHGQIFNWCNTLKSNKGSFQAILASFSYSLSRCYPQYGALFFFFKFANPSHPPSPIKTQTNPTPFVIVTW